MFVLHERTDCCCTCRISQRRERRVHAVAPAYQRLTSPSAQLILTPSRIP